MTTTRRGAKMTVAEYMAIDTLEGLWELCDGELYEMPPPILDHQYLIKLLCQLIDAYLITTSPRMGITLPGVGVALSEFRMFIPDLTYVRAERAHLLRRNLIEGAPDLVVEVLSSDRRRDLVMKRGWYADAGVPEYWIMDPVNETITILELSGSDYVERAVLTRNDTLTTPAIPGFAFQLEQLFGEPMRQQTLIS